MPRSKKFLVTLIVVTPIVNPIRFGETPATRAPVAIPISPASIAVRRERRSTNRPINGESKPDSSETVSATPISESETLKPLAMIAINGGVNL